MSDKTNFELEYGDKQDSSSLDQVPENEDVELRYEHDYTGDKQGTSEERIRWDRCDSVLEDEEGEEVEFVLDHEKNSAEMISGVDPEELEQEYQCSRYQVMGSRPTERTQEDYDWEPIRDLSGPTDAEEAAASVVAGIGVASLTATEAVFKTTFQILSAIAK